MIIRTRTPQQDARRARLVAALVHWQPERRDERSAADHAAWQQATAEHNQARDDAAMYGGVGRDDRNVGY